jgi:hypothetical protein
LSAQAGDLFLRRLECPLRLIKETALLVDPEQRLAGFGVDQPHPLAFPAEAEAGCPAQERALFVRLDRLVPAPDQTVSLKSRLQVFAQGIVEEVFLDAEPGIEILLVLVLPAGTLPR